MILNRDLNSGFTLIELLVVIAIIGLLSSVVIASLNNAKGKGNDSAVKSNLVNLRTQGEVLYAGDYNFNKVCGADGETQNGTIASAIAEANSLNGDGSVTCGVPASGNAKKWAVAADLPGGGAFCVDSQGASRVQTEAGTPYTSDVGGVTPALSSVNAVECN